MLRILPIVALLSLIFMAPGCVKVNEKSEKPEPTRTTTQAAPTSPAEKPNEAAPAISFPKLNEINFTAVNYDDNFHSHGKGRFGGLLAILGSHQFHAEFIPDTETGDVLAIVYDNHFKPFQTETKELTLALKVGDEPKTFTLLVDHDGSEGKPATFKITDVDLAKILAQGWQGDARVMFTSADAPASGNLIPARR